MTFFTNRQCPLGSRTMRRSVSLPGVVFAASLHLGCTTVIPPVESTVRPKYDFGVCTRDPDIEFNATKWSYANLFGPAVSNLHPYEFHRAVLESDVSYHYDPFAPMDSVKVLPIRLSNLSCDRIHKVALEMLPLRPCSGDICALSMPSEIALPNKSGVCRLEKMQASVGPVRGNWLGQTDLPIRSRYFCETEPVVPRNATTRILDKEAEVAWLESYAYGYRVSLLLTQAESDAQAFINHSDPWIVKLFKKDPGSVDAIMLRVASALDAIPEPPQYDKPYIAMLATEGYASGSRQGTFEVEAKLLLIEASATIAEVALMEIAMGPLGGAAVLRTAISRLGRIPIFVPGAVGGMGGVIRVGQVVHKVSSWSSKKLGEALIKAGKVRLEGHEAHHIVAGGHEWAAPAREVLAKFGIKLDEAVNGVFLPATKASPNPLASQVHRPLSNMEAYYTKVNNALKDLKTKKQVIAELENIAKQLTDGTFL